MIILLGGEKGGTGKSTLAQNLAVFFAIYKNLDVVLVDADPQGTTSDWIDERNENEKLKIINCIQKLGRIERTILDLNNRYDVVIVDVGGHDSEALRSAMTTANLILIPVRPKRRDLKTLQHVSSLVSLAQALNNKLIVRSVITQAPNLPSQFKRILDAKDVCSQFDLCPQSSFTHTRNVYDDIEEGGCSVFESDDDKAKKELIDIGNEVFNIIKEELWD